MAVRLRLSRIGKKNNPFYRIVAIDSRKARDGMALDILGTYDAVKGALVCINMEGVEEWKKKGALPTDSVAKILKMAAKQIAKESASK